MITFPETCPICGGGHALTADFSPCIVSLAHRCDVTGLVMQRAARELGLTDAKFNDLVCDAWREVREYAPEAAPQPAPSDLTAAPVPPPRRWWHVITGR